jgi:hypothetical protein
MEAGCHIWHSHVFFLFGSALLFPATPLGFEIHLMIALYLLFEREDYGATLILTNLGSCVYWVYSGSVVMNLVLCLSSS